MPVTYRGGSLLQAGPFDPWPGPLPLPTGTQVGDLLVVAMTSGTLSDSRLTSFGTGFWWGYATTLANIVTPSGSGPWAVTCAAFAPPLNIGTPVTASGSGNIVTIPSGHGSSVICAQLAGSVGTAAAPTLPAGYTNGVGAVAFVAGSRIDYWDSTGPADSPAETALAGANVSTWSSAVLPVNVIMQAPACRLYPRADALGVGSGRLYPRAGTQQAGRLTGPY